MSISDSFIYMKKSLNLILGFKKILRKKKSNGMSFIKIYVIELILFIYLAYLFNLNSMSIYVRSKVRVAHHLFLFHKCAWCFPLSWCETKLLLGPYIYESMYCEFGTVNLQTIIGVVVSKTIKKNYRAKRYDKTPIELSVLSKRPCDAKCATEWNQLILMQYEKLNAQWVTSNIVFQ